jgi:hypothetical protein
MACASEPMKALMAVPLVLLALLGAGGMSSLQDDDYCLTHIPFASEDVGFGTEVKWLPPGWRCSYDSGGEHRERTTGSWPWFLIALAGEALVAARYLHGGSRAARFAFAATVALAVAGAISLIGGVAFGFFWGLLLGMPLAWLVGGRDLMAALAAGAAVFLTACFTLWFGFSSAVIGCYVFVALVAMTAAAARADRPRPAR